MADEALPSYTPQALDDILPIYRPDSTASALNSYTLRQVAPTIQTLQQRDAASDAPSYHIKTYATAGFMNKKPHITIAKLASSVARQPTEPETESSSTGPARRRLLFRRSPSPSARSSTPKPIPAVALVEARFDTHGTGTTINYISPATQTSNAPDGESTLPPAYNAIAHPSQQRLELVNSIQQILRTHFGISTHYWQEHPGNKDVIHLVDEGDEIVMRFIYNPPSVPISRQNSGNQSSMSASDFARTDPAGITGKRRKSSTTGSGLGFAEYDVGNLELVGDKIENEQIREEILCSCVVMVERARRRAVNLGLAYSRPGATCGATAVGRDSSVV